jgi:hypothetical protein
MRPRSLLVALVLVSSACTRTIVQKVPVQDVVGPANTPTDLKVTTKNGQVLNLWSATIVRDTVVGFSRRGDDIRRTRLAVARTDVETVSTRKIDPFVSTVFAVVVGATALTLFLASTLSSGGPLGQ